MKNLVVLLAFAVGTLTGWAQGDFTKTLSAEEAVAAGLAKLTPAELAQLKAVVERYKTGEVAVVKQEAAQRVAAVQAEATKQIKAAEEKAAPAEESKKQPAWLSALAVLKRTEKSPDKNEAVESRIAGEFRGWRGSTTFPLENGQIWQQVDGEPYVGVKLPSPAVRIYPGVFGTFWMKVDGVRPPVKVKPIKLD